MGKRPRLFGLPDPVRRGEGGRRAGERARRQSPEADHSSRARYLKQTLAGALPRLSAMVLGRFSLLLSHLTGCSCFPFGETKNKQKTEVLLRPRTVAL